MLHLVSVQPTNLVQPFNKTNAFMFTAGLVWETAWRLTIKQPSQCGYVILAPASSSTTEELNALFGKLFLLQCAKIMQCLPLAWAGQCFDSKPKKSIATALAVGSQLPLVHQCTIGRTNVLRFSNMPLHYEQVESDRPDAIAFVHVEGEMVNIASKVLGSLAMGSYVQKMATGKTKGKIGLAVSAILLAISAWNICRPDHVHIYYS